MSHAYIAIGGNLGDIRANFDSAYEMLQGICSIQSVSKLYQTPAIGPLVEGRQQPDYLNAVIYVATELGPHDLLMELHAIEARHGRERKEHWGARTLDLDLLDYDGLISNDANLTLPHPRLHERLFVLQPMADIQADWQHPISGLTISAMIHALDDTNTHLFEGTVWKNNA